MKTHLTLTLAGIVAFSFFSCRKEKKPSELIYEGLPIRKASCSGTGENFTTWVIQYRLHNSVSGFDTALTSLPSGSRAIDQRFYFIIDSTSKPGFACVALESFNKKKICIILR